MPTTHPTPVRDALASAVVQRLDAGAGPGVIEMLDAADTLIATLTFSDPAFGAPVAGVATASPITKESSTPAAGTITKARMKDSNGVLVWECSVSPTGGGGDIELGSTVISVGQEVSLSSLTYTAPA